jgi:hypothetical protein
MGKWRVWVKAALASDLISHRIKSEFVAVFSRENE